MFSVNGNPIFQSELSVLQDLKLQALLSGKEIFGVMFESGDDVMVSCPFHKGGKERKPSFGINKKTMMCHCFTCGYVGTLYDVISRIFGYDDKGVYGKHWLSMNFISVSIENRQRFEFNLRNDSKKNTKVYF